MFLLLMVLLFWLLVKAFLAIPLSMFLLLLMFLDSPCSFFLLVSLLTLVVILDADSCSVQDRRTSKPELAPGAVTLKASGSLTGFVLLSLPLSPAFQLQLLCLLALFGSGTIVLVIYVVLVCRL